VRDKNKFSRPVILRKMSRVGNLISRFIQLLDVLLELLELRVLRRA
jgi:hypothetical protein